MESMYAIGGAFFALMVPMGVAIYYQYYPKMAADKEKMLALAYVPEIVNYLVIIWHSVNLHQYKLSAFLS